MLSRGFPWPSRSTKGKQTPPSNISRTGQVTLFSSPTPGPSYRSRDVPVCRPTWVMALVACCRSPRHDLPHPKRRCACGQASPVGNAFAYSTLLPGEGHEYGKAIALDDVGDAYVTDVAVGQQGAHQKAGAGFQTGSCFYYIGASGAGADTRAGPSPARAPAAVAAGGRDCVGSRRSRVVFVPSFAVYLQLSTMVCAVCGNAGSPDLIAIFASSPPGTLHYIGKTCANTRSTVRKIINPCAHILLWYNGGTYGANSPYL